MFFKVLVYQGVGSSAGGGSTSKKGQDGCCDFAESRNTAAVSVVGFVVFTSAYRGKISPGPDKEAKSSDLSGLLNTAAGSVTLFPAPF